MRERHKSIPTTNRSSDDPAYLRKFLLALGLIFPLASSGMADAELKSDEHVMFLPDIAYQTSDGRLIAGVQAWVYEKQKRRGLTHMLALALRIEIGSLSPEKRAQLYERTQLFRVDSERNKHIEVRFEDGQNHLLPPTGRNGRTGGFVELKQSPPHNAYIGQLPFVLTGKGMPASVTPSYAIYAPPEGLSVISDIDDTIKISSVGELRQMLITTFMEDFAPVDGMNLWYQSLNAQSNNIAFHYVSSSPIQLYPALRSFMDEAGYPKGSMHLREATHWKDIIPGPKTSRRHKTAMIERILAAYPKRRFMLVGDSSEADPDIYADLMRRFPHQINCIVIREVINNHPRRNYEKHFIDIDADKWIVSPSLEALRDFAKKCFI